MQKGRVTLELRNDIAVVGLNRPEKCNAIDAEMAEELHDALNIANKEARACVIFGHGKHFCAGLDLRWMSDQMAHYGPAGKVGDSRPKSHAPMRAITHSNIPYIVAIQGAAIGLGFELAAAAHVRVADETAYFSLPEARRGIFVGGGGAVRISRLIGVARMQDMMLTGRKYQAEEAMSCNIVQYLVPGGSAIKRSLELAAEVTKNSATSNMAILKSLPRIAEMSAEEGLFWEEVVARSTFGPEAMSRIRSFLEKDDTPQTQHQPR